jgi:hypothetical protein
LWAAFWPQKGVRFEGVVSVNPFVCNKTLSSFPRFSIFFRFLVWRRLSKLRSSLRTLSCGFAVGFAERLRGCGVVRGGKTGSTPRGKVRKEQKRFSLCVAWRLGGFAHRSLLGPPQAPRGVAFWWWRRPFEPALDAAPGRRAAPPGAGLELRGCDGGRAGFTPGRKGRKERKER